MRTQKIISVDRTELYCSRSTYEKTNHSELTVVNQRSCSSRSSVATNRMNLCQLFTCRKEISQTSRDVKKKKKDFILFSLSGLISEVMTWFNDENRMFIDDWTEKYVFILPASSSKHICSEPSANQNITSNRRVLFIASSSHKLIING